MGRPDYEDSVAGDTVGDNPESGADSSLGYLQHSADQGTTIGLLNESAEDSIGTLYGTQTETADDEA